MIRIDEGEGMPITQRTEYRQKDEIEPPHPDQAIFGAAPRFWKAMRFTDSSVPQAAVRHQKTNLA